MPIQPVILCGGQGLRLWPLSRKNLPKQFLRVFDNKSLFQITLERVSNIKNIKTPIIVTSKIYEPIIHSELEKIPIKVKLILEPESKNTTASIYLAAKISKNQLLIEGVFINSVASRDLRSGTVLSYSDIKLQHKLLAAAKTITPGQKITKGNTQIIEYYGKPASDSLKSIDDLEYMEALRTIQSGNPIRLSDIKRALMIKKGDSVLLETGKGQLLISIRMTALEEGKLDDQVILMNPESGETVRAIVTGPGKTKGI